MYAQFANGVQVTVGDQSVTLRSNGIPDQTSPYFSAGHALYEAPHAGMVINPHGIAGQNYAFQVPTTPGYASPSDTPLGPIGMAVNGVALFDQYAAGRQLLVYRLPWPKGKIEAAPEMLTTLPSEWHNDVSTLHTLIENFGKRDPVTKWATHQAFGPLSGPEWGVLSWKHLDYHLRQF
jgi:hypothetical protein